MYNNVLMLYFALFLDGEDNYNVEGKNNPS